MVFDRDYISGLLGIPTTSGILDSLKTALAASGSKITNWNVGGLTRELGEMLSSGIGDLHGIVVTAVSAAFWETATGAWLSQLAIDRGCPRKTAQATQGYLRASRVTTGADVVIKDQTRIKTNVTVDGKALHFVVNGQTVLPAAETSVLVPVIAAEAKAAYNVAPGTITVPVTYVAGIDAWTNLPDWITVPGTDDEQDEDLRVRGRYQWARLATATIRDTLAGVALSHASVTSVQVLDDWIRGQGTVDVVISTPTGTPSELVIAEVQSLMTTRDVLCTDILVRGPTPRVVNVAATLCCRTAIDATAAAALKSDAIELANAYVGNGASTDIPRLGIGEPLVRQRLASAWMQLSNVSDVAWVAPTTNVEAVRDELIELGTLDISVAVWSAELQEYVTIL